MRLFQKVAFLVPAILIMLNGCSSSVSVAGSLLAPSDLPELDLAAEQPRVGQSNRGAQAAQATLKGEGIQLFHSIVVFDSPAEAHRALANISPSPVDADRQGAASAGVGDESILIDDEHETQRRISVLFRKGKVFQRVSVAGRVTREDAITYARIAEKKVRA